MIKTELYFGMSGTDEAIHYFHFNTFAREHITPRFPDGYTLLEARGLWRMRSGQTILEESRVVVLLHGGGDLISKSIDDIREEYKRKFNQESVLRVDTEVRASF